MKLGVISDTHGVLREEVVERLQECDYIIHAGDIGNKDIIDKLESITKTFVVRGNNDDDEWGLTLPEYREIEMDEILIYLVHDKADIPKDLREVDLVIYGHSHKFSNEKIDNIIYLNPGSVSLPRGVDYKSFSIMNLENDNIKIEQIRL